MMDDKLKELEEIERELGKAYASRFQKNAGYFRTGALLFYQGKRL